MIVMLPPGICRDIFEVISPKYPRWERKLIKRKYGNNPAVYLDVWKPFAPRLYDLLPKYQLDKRRNIYKWQ